MSNENSNPKTSWFKSHKILGYDPLGAKTDATAAEAVSLGLSQNGRMFILLAGICYSFVTIAGMHDHTGREMLATLPFWGVAICQHVAIYVGIILAAGYLQYRVVTFRLYLPIANLLAYVISGSLLVVTFDVSMHVPRDDYFAITSARDLMILFIFETLFYRYFYPNALAELRQSQTQDPDPTPAPSTGLPPKPVITVSGQSIPLSDVLWMKSKEHMVEIKTQSQVHVVRARLSDLVAQTEDVDGILAHRSYWVSAQEIARLETCKSQDVLHLKTGGSLTVARPRRDKVRSWMSDQNMAQDNQGAPLH